MIEFKLREFEHFINNVEAVPSELTIVWFLQLRYDRTSSEFLGRVLLDPFLGAVLLVQAGHQNLVGFPGLGRQLDHLVVVILRAPHVRSEMLGGVRAWL